MFRLSSAFLPCLSSIFLVFQMGMLNYLNFVFNFSLAYITPASESLSEFVIDGHFYTSPNQQQQPPTFSFGDSESLPDDTSPTQLRKRVWAVHNRPYLPFVLNSPFHGVMTSRFATPPGQIPLEKDKYGYHLPADVAKSWKIFEKSCRQAASLLRTSFERDHPKSFFYCLTPAKPSEFGYFKAHDSEDEARSALSKSLDAFVILLAYVSFYIALCSKRDAVSVSSKPIWFQVLSDRKDEIHPEWIQLLADSPIADFTTPPQRLGTIVNVSRCSWLNLVPYMIKANVPVWLYWGCPPAFGQPLDTGALRFAPRSHPQSRAPPALPPLASQPVRPPFVPSGHGGADQLPSETWREFIRRQNNRKMARLAKENGDQRQVREGREMTASKKRCPGKKGPAVYIWEEDNGVWTRTLLTRREVDGYWGQYRSSQKIFNAIDNCWDLCLEFDEGTIGEVEEYDSNDSDNEIPPQVDRHKQSQRPPSPQNRKPGDAPDCPPMVVNPTPAQVVSDCAPMVVDPTPPTCPPMVVDSTPHPVLTPPQVVLDCPPMVVDPTPHSVPTPAQVASDPDPPP